MFERRYLCRSLRSTHSTEMSRRDAEGIRNSQWCASPQIGGAIPHQVLKAVCSQNGLGWKGLLKVICSEQGHLQFPQSRGAKECTGLCSLGLEVTHSMAWGMFYATKICSISTPDSLSSFLLAATTRPFVPADPSHLASPPSLLWLIVCSMRVTRISHCKTRLLTN